MNKEIITIKDLIESLQQYNENMRVCVGIDFDESIDLTLVEKDTTINANEKAPFDFVSLW